MKRKTITTAVLAASLMGLFQATPSWAVPADVKEAFQKNCKKCHGWDGKADTGEGRKLKLQDLTSADYQKKAKDDEILKAILEGTTDPKDPKRKMRSYKDAVSEAQAKELVKVVRAFGKSPGPFPDEK
jgi:mono/diheme cytochrome c family protein